MSEARQSPRVRTFDKTIKLKKFTVRASERASVRINSGEGKGSLKVTRTGELENAIFSYQDLRKKITTAVLSTIDSGVHITFSRQGLTEEERERVLPRARTGKESQEDREKEKKGARERRRNNTY